jgi:hypothetical protein
MVFILRNCRIYIFSSSYESCIYVTKIFLNIIENDGIIPF